MQNKEQNNKRPPGRPRTISPEEIQEVRRKREEILNGKVCSYCKENFRARRIDQKYCSRECSINTHNAIKQIKQKGFLSQELDYALNNVENEENNERIFGGWE